MTPRINAGTVPAKPARRVRLLLATDTADRAAAYLRERARFLAFLARLDASVDEWRAQGRPRAALLPTAPRSYGPLGVVGHARSGAVGSDRGPGPVGQLGDTGGHR